jgi:hypothetical protein
MDQEIRKRLEYAAITGSAFSEDPDWFFVFVENPEIRRDLYALLGAENEPEDLILVFAKGNDWPGHLDACGAAYRMKEAANESGYDLELHKLTVFFHSPASAAIRKAFGVPEGQECVGAFLLKKKAGNSREVRWNVFSSIQ